MTEAEMKSLFSERLQMLLGKYELKQNDLSRIIGVSESTVGKWILCKAMPRTGVIQKLADYFHVSMKFFLEADSDEACFVERDLLLDEHERDLIQKYRLLSPSGRATVDAVIEVQYRSIFPQGPPDTS